MGITGIPVVKSEKWKHRSKEILRISFHKEMPFAEYRNLPYLYAWHNL